MTGKSNGKFRIGEWLVEPDTGRVSRNGETATLRPREMDLLVCLARRPGEVRSVDDIMREVWAGVEVTNDSLYFSISQLRKVLDGASADTSVIETVPKRGYRLAAPVAECTPPGDDIDSKRSTPDDGATGTAGSGRPAKRAAIAAVAAIVLVAVVFATVDRSRGPDDPSDSFVAGRDSVANTGSIAVMPFVDLTPGSDYTYFSDGITEEILNRLTRVPGLRVAARTSSFTFKDSDADAVSIGRALGVSSILEGSVRKEGDRVRIAVQLIDAGTGFQVWSDSYDRDLVSIFDVQNEISHRVSDALKLALAGPPGEGGDRSGRPATAAALDEYLLGLEGLRTSSFESLRAAVAHFEAVLDIDPGFDAARVQLAETKLQILNTGASDDDSLIGEAGALVTGVLERHPDDSDAHRVYGVVLKWQEQWDKAREQFERALELAPSDSKAMTHLVHAALASGDLERARMLLDRAIRIDPFSDRILHSYTSVQRQLGATDLALEAAERAVALHPEKPNPAWMLGQLQMADIGQLAEGLGSFLASAARDPDDYEIAAYVAGGYLSLGMLAEAEPWIRSAEELGPDDAVTALSVRAVYELLQGNHRSARDAAERAITGGDYRFVAHSALTAPLLTLLGMEASRQGDVEEIADLLSNRVPGSVKYAGKFEGDDVAFRNLLALSNLPRRWYVSLAAAHSAAGNDAEARAALDKLRDARLDAVLAIRDQLRGDDYLLEAEVLAIEGDADGAFAMLDDALDNNLLFLWQVQYANNAAFTPLHEDPRWSGLLDRVESRIGTERRKAVNLVGMLGAAGRSP